MGSINGFAKPGDTTCADTVLPLSAYDVEKRLLDIVLSLITLLVLSPLLILSAIAIKLDSRGPLLYRRKVVGRGKTTFDAFKLRTMVDGADGLDCGDPVARRELDANHKLRCDSRITRVGKVLRKTSIDEVPQLLNVLIGQMSLVGPRMISLLEIDKFGIWQDKILSVKPGITGLWQVSGRSKLSYEDRVQLNLHYVDHRCIALDLYILARTIPTVLSGNGAY